MNALLVEIMIAVLFFALCAAVIMEIFGYAKKISIQAETRSDAVVCMQDMAERMYVAESMTELLYADGFAETDGKWIKECGDYEIAVEVSEKMTASGMLTVAKVSASEEGDVIAEIPCVRYVGNEVK